MARRFVLRAGSGDPPAQGLSMTADPGAVALAGTAATLTGPSALDYASDWSTETGTSNTALLDGTKWDDISVAGSTEYSGEPWGIVMSASGLGFPSTMANVSRWMVWQEGGTSAWCNVIINSAKWPVPAVGEYAYYRVYTRTQAQNGDNIGNLHWWHMGGGNPPAWWSDSYGISGGNYQLAFQTHPNGFGGSGTSTGWEMTPAGTINTTYRREIRLHRTGTLTAEIAIRMYVGDTLIAETTDFTDWDVPANDLSGTELVMSSSGIAEALFTIVQFGANGSVDPGTMAAPGYLYTGGFAVRVSASADAWIGPYVEGEAA